MVNLERRGHTLEAFLHAGRRTGVFPVYHVRFGAKEYWFHTQDEVDAFRAEQAQRLGKELVLADERWRPGEPASRAGRGRVPDEDVTGTRWTSGTRCGG